MDGWTSRLQMTALLGYHLSASRFDRSFDRYRGCCRGGDDDRRRRDCRRRGKCNDLTDLAFWEKLFILSGTYCPIVTTLCVVDTLRWTSIKRRWAGQRCQSWASKCLVVFCSQVTFLNRSWLLQGNRFKIDFGAIGYDQREANHRPT